MTTLAAPTLAPPLVAPHPMRWTCADFHRVGESGAFEGKRAMLIDGVILEQGPMNPPHALTLEAVDEALRIAFGSGWRYRIQLPLVLGQNTDPMPDFAIIAGSHRGAQGHPTTANLVVEISDTTLDFDMNFKRLLYAKAGIPEYWVIDVNARVLWVYRDPKSGDYHSRQSLSATDSIQPLSSGNAIAVADLLR